MPEQERLVVAQRDGKIFWFNKNENTGTKTILADFSDQVGVVTASGLLGLAIHPKFGNGTNNYFYIYYTTRNRHDEHIPNGGAGHGCDYELYWSNLLILAFFEVNPDNMTHAATSDFTMFKICMYGYP